MAEPVISKLRTPIAQIEEAVAAIQKPRGSDAMRTFLGEAERAGVLAAHPDTIAALDAADPAWRESLRVRVIEHRWLARSHLYTGRAFVEAR